MKKITKKITTEEFKGGELIKRTIEETVEEKDEDSVKFAPVPQPWTTKPPIWCETKRENIALL